MRLVTDAGETIKLGTVETAPTIGIIDYSRRVTDDFGVTTVVERGFARRMSLRLGLPMGEVDGLQRRLAALRATAALWVADERFTSLAVRGFYKEFALDLATPALSYCTLEVEGLAGTDTPADPGTDPAPAGQPSTLQLLQPTLVTDAVLITSNAAEADAPVWSASASYPLGARVIRTSTHRVYEAVAAVPAGDDPVAGSGKWLDIGPTNRWAMFDQALGSVTSAPGPIALTLEAGTVNAVALLDVVAATVRVQAAGYDRTLPVGAGPVTFLDMPATSGRVTVTIAGSGAVSVGTLLIGRLVALGVTEISPTAGITDYSRKDVDDFGEVTIVERAWAKRMTANALIRTDALDVVANRIAAVRARPSLWIGQSGLDSLTIYGFFKDFSIEVGESVSKLALSIEGLSKAPPLVPGRLGGPVAWPDVTDPLGNKPDDNATNSADPKSPFGPGQTVGDALDRFEALDEAIRNVGGDGATQAAIDARDAALAAASNSQTARDQSQAARDAAKAAQDQALASAQAAAGSLGTAQQQATIASQKADEAGEQATIATASATVAATKAGEASVSASDAATSESNAAGSANAASSSASVSASSARAATQAADFPLSFAQKGALYTNNGWVGAGIPLSDGDFVAASTGYVYKKTGYYAVGFVRPMLLKGRLLRYQARLRAVDANVTYSADVEYSNTDTEAATGSYSGFTTLTPADGWRTIDYLIDGRAVTTTYAKPWLRGSAGTGATVEVEYFRVLDITDQQAAADSASASAESARNAATSAANGAAAASAAETSRTQAQTAAGQASTYRDQASTSATNAAGSASTASTQALLSAQSSTAALSIVTAQMPRDFSQEGMFFSEGFQETRPSLDATWTFPVVAGVGKVAQRTGGVGLGTKGSMITAAGRRYRTTVRSRVIANPTGQAIRIRAYVLVSNAETLELVGIPSADFIYPAVNVWYDVTAEWTATGRYAVSPRGDLSVLAASGAGSPDTVTQVASLWIEDITESSVAAGYASAANSSANTASTKASDAGVSASAAAASAQQASASRDGASTSAQAAQGSAAAADGSRSSAASYAEAAAGYRNQATDAAAAAKSSAEAVTNASGALAQRVDSVEATANGASASASTTAQAVSDVKTGLAGARLELLATSPGGPASVTIQSDRANGAVVRLVGAVEIDGSLTVNESITTGKIAPNSVTIPALASAWAATVENGVDHSAPVTLTTANGTVRIDVSFDYLMQGGTSSTAFTFRVRRDGSVISRAYKIESSTTVLSMGLFFIDNPPAGAHTYDIEFGRSAAGTSTLNVTSGLLFLQEFRR